MQVAKKIHIDFQYILLPISRFKSKYVFSYLAFEVFLFFESHDNLLTNSQWLLGIDSVDNDIIGLMSGLSDSYIYIYKENFKYLNKIFLFRLEMKRIKIPRVSTKPLYYTQKTQWRLSLPRVNNRLDFVYSHSIVEGLW